MTIGFVTLTDKSYYPRALKTIQDLRTHGEWEGDILLLCVEFDPPAELETLDIFSQRLFHINHQPLFDSWAKYPLQPMADNRHYGKVYQWDKLQVFRPEILQRWDRIVFLDAGLRVTGPVAPLLALEGPGFFAPDDADPYDNGNRFRVQLDLPANPSCTERLLSTFGASILDERYFLNCIFMMDTCSIPADAFDTMVKWMFAYPIMRCNEMGIMNLFFTMQHKVWKPFPQRVQTSSGDRYLFGWSEYNYRERPTWEQFCFLKYPATYS